MGSKETNDFDQEKNGQIIAGKRKRTETEKEQATDEETGERKGTRKMGSCNIYIPRALRRSTRSLPR